jgi:hypothetical protein
VTYESRRIGEKKPVAGVPEKLLVLAIGGLIILQPEGALGIIEVKGLVVPARDVYGL